MIWQGHLSKELTYLLSIMDCKKGGDEDPLHFLGWQKWKAESEWTGWAVREPRLLTESPLSTLQRFLSSAHWQKTDSYLNPPQRRSFALNLSSSSYFFFWGTVSSLGWFGHSDFLECLSFLISEHFWSLEYSTVLQFRSSRCWGRALLVH